jgi:hypothetical protein
LNRRFLIFILAILSLSYAEAQYIAEVVEYTPAPGQLINVAPWGTPGGARSIEGGVNGSVCLGAFGGFVVFRFEHPVENDPHNPFGVDFTIFGNPIVDWSEPGVVWVMKDENENGEADDTWYELAGSDYWFSSTQRERSVTYINPGGDEAQDIAWEDNMGKSGVIRANSVHTQPYYPLQDSFPNIASDRYTLEGTLIRGLVNEQSFGMKSILRGFGYADNQLRGSALHTVPDNPYTREVENSGGDAFDIGWAVDSEGLYKELDRIHFVKVQNGIQADGGWLGELSTELTGAVDIPPDPAINGETEMVVIRDLPPLLEAGEYQMEVFVFQSGRVKLNGSVEWTTSNPGATVNGNHLLMVSDPGPLTITAQLSYRPEINATVSTTVRLNQTYVPDGTAFSNEVILYPNPASDYFMLKGASNSLLTLFNASGKALMRVDHVQEEKPMDISVYPEGVYLVKLEEGNSIQWIKLVKR